MSKCLWVWQMSLTRFVSFLLIQLDTGQIGIICILAIELGVSGMQPSLSFFIPKQFLKNHEFKDWFGGYLPCHIILQPNKYGTPHSTALKYYILVRNS